MTGPVEGSIKDKLREMRDLVWHLEHRIQDQRELHDRVERAMAGRVMAMRNLAVSLRNALKDLVESPCSCAVPQHIFDLLAQADGELSLG